MKDFFNSVIALLLFKRYTTLDRWIEIILCASAWLCVLLFVYLLYDIHTN